METSFACAASQSFPDRRPGFLRKQDRAAPNILPSGITPERSEHQ
jgi:hypothetical protein